MRLRHSVPSAAAILVAALPLALPGATPEAREEVPGVPNFAVVSPVLSRGAQPTREGFCRLSERGVRTILALRSGRADDAALAGLGFNLYRIRARQWDPETEEVVRAMKVILAPEYQPVFVHCQAGKDRTGLVVAVYRILVDRWSVEDAIDERKAFGAWGLWWENNSYLRRLGSEEARGDLAAAIEAAPLPTIVRVP